MSDAETAHADTTTADTHDDHGDGHAGEPFGPVDVWTWAYAIAGGAVGVLVALAMLVATGA
jgi:hypothetical protein